MEFTKANFQKLQSKVKELEKQFEIEISSLSKLNESQKIAKIGSWNWDVVNNTVEWSDMMFTILGLDPNIDFPSYELALHHVHEDDKVEYEASLSNALNNKSDYFFKNRIIKTDGTILNVISRGKSILNDNNEIVRMTGTVQDVTLSKQLLDTNKQLEQFANILSHDFKAPIRSIVSFIELIKTKSYKNLNEEGKEYFAFIDKSARDLLELVNDLLSGSKLNSPKLNITKVLMNEFIKSVIFDLDINLKESKGVVEVGNLPDFILCDRVKMRQVFQNLITNAIKYTANEVNPKIELSCVIKEYEYVFFIKDNGIGIPTVYVNEVFNPYFRVKNDTTFSGNGLGLSITKRIVELHKGTLGYNPRENGGTTFYFSISKQLE